MRDGRGQRGRGARAGSASEGRWTRAQAAELLAQCFESGETLYSYAQRHGLSEQRLYYWRARLAEERRPARARLAPVVVRGSAPGVVELGIARACSAVTVSYGDVRIEVSEPEAVDVRWIAALVQSLGRSEP